MNKPIKEELERATLSDCLKMYFRSSPKDKEFWREQIKIKNEKENGYK